MIRDDVALVVVETKHLNLTITGPPFHPVAQAVMKYSTAGDEIDASLSVWCPDEDIRVWAYMPVSGSIEEYTGPKSAPLFFENQTYQIVIEEKTQLNVSFFHQNPQLRSAVRKPLPSSHIQSGLINFGSDIGLTDIEIHVDQKPYLHIAFEVFPAKLDYARDYYQLIRDINEEVHNLAFDFLRKTYLKTSLLETREQSPTEFYSILTTIFDRFNQAISVIARHPHRILVNNQRILPASRVKRTNSKSIRWITRNLQHYDASSNLPNRLLDISKVSSYDTYENRFVRWVVTQTIRRIRSFEQRYSSTGKDPIVSDRLESMVRTLQQRIDSSFLRQVGELHSLSSVPLVLQLAPGYRDLYKYYLMLAKGLNISGHIFDLSVKELWLLYEYWCFLKINHILRTKYQLIRHDLLKITKNGMFVRLKKGAKSTLRYRNPRTNEDFELCYNVLEGASITTGQKPDTVLTLEKKGSSVHYQFIFDAKYRLNPATNGSFYPYSTPGPEVSDINAMHRYRDAIVMRDMSGRYSRTVTGAFVLFPYHDENEFEQHDLYKSIAVVGVGAFPLLPRHTKLLTDFLESIIEETPYTNFERNVLPIGIYEHMSVRLTKNVLVGGLRSKAQLEYVLKSKQYHIPCKSLRLDKYHLEYLAIYQSANLFGKEHAGIKYYARISNWRVMPRAQIPFRSGGRNPDEPYYVFEVQGWEELEQIIKPDGYGVRGSHIFTNDQLLRRATTLPELTLGSIEQWRVWVELCRFRDDVKTVLDSNLIDAENVPFSYYCLGNVSVRLAGNRVILEIDDAVKCTVHVNDFVRNIRSIFRCIFSE